MDSKRFNIYAGSILGALLLFLLLNFFSQLIYVGPEHAGHEEEVLAFAVPVEDGAEADEPAEVDLAALAAEADPGAGERVFNRCRACHAMEDGQNGVGPHLWGVVGREIASVDGFSYSSALSELEGAWDLEALSAFIENPSGYAPGTAMSFAGLPDPEDRVNVIAYLNEADGSPVELAPEQTASAEETATDETATDETMTDETASDETVSQETAATAEEGTVDEAGSEQATTDQAASEEASDEASAEEATADAAAEEETATETASAEQATTAESAEDAAGEETAADGPYAALLASGSAENGQKVFRRCQACHTLEEGVHRVGPSLYGVVGREIGGVDGFNYSQALAEHGGEWTLSNLDAYLENTREFIPGNKMSFPGLRDAQDRIDVIIYIDEADGSPEIAR